MTRYNNKQLISLNFGGEAGKNLEPLFSEELFAELEDWSTDISRDPMVLRELERIDQDTETDQQDQTNLKPKSIMRGPRP